MRLFLLLFSLITIVTVNAQIGIGTDRPHFSAQLDVSSTTKGLLPPRMTREQQVAIALPVEGLVIYCTDCIPKGLYNYDGTTWNPLVSKGNAPGDMQYWDGTKWIMIPVGIPSWILKLSASGIPGWGTEVGCRGLAGGIVFYDKGFYSDGWRYLEAAPSDQSTGTDWGCYGTYIPGAGSARTAIGTGQANTTAIVNACSTAGIAARICDDLVLNGYSDWFLPSKNELDELFKERYTIGGFDTYNDGIFQHNNWYWSSSNYDQLNAWGQRFHLGDISLLEKSDNGAFVRAIRAF